MHGVRGRLLLLLLAMIGAAACAPPQPEILDSSPLSFGAPIVDPLPLRIGYAFDPSVETLFPAGRGQRGAPYRLQLGPATKAAFGRVFPALFLDARPIDGLAAVQGSPGDLDGLVRIEIVEVFVPGVTVVLTYQLTFVNPDGLEEGRWRVLGAGRTKYQIEDNAEPAVRMAIADLARNLERQSAIRTWLEQDRPPIDVGPSGDS